MASKWPPNLTTPLSIYQSFGVIDAYLLGTVKYLKTVFSLMAYFNRLDFGARSEIIE